MGTVPIMVTTMRREVVVCWFAASTCIPLFTL